MLTSRDELYDSSNLFAIRDESCILLETLRNFPEARSSGRVVRVVTSHASHECETLLLLGLHSITITTWVVIST